MSYNCYVCKNLISGGTRGLFTHLRSKHFVCELRGVALRCGQGDCVRCYSTFNSLAHHLRTQHHTHDGTVNQESGFENCDPSVTVGEVSLNHNTEAPIANMGDRNCTAASFIASLLSSTSVTQKNVQSVIEHTSALVADIVEDISRDVMRSFLATNTVLKESGCQQLVNTIKQHCKPFELLDTQHKRTTYFRKNYGMVDGKSIFLGNRYDQRVDPVNGSMRQIIIRDTFQYVPIMKLIALLLSDTSVHDEVVHDHTSRDGVKRDLCDGSLYECNPLFVEDKEALQLCLYFDECEVVNPLGSRRGIHKIGFIHLTLRNMRPMFTSRLNNIHIVAAFNSLDRVKYGFDRILAPIVHDIRELGKGVDFRLQDGRVVHKRGTAVQVLGDNLGLNQLFGFVESFSAIHFCRLCMISKADCNVTHRDDM